MGNSKVKAKNAKCLNKDCKEKLEAIIPEGMLFTDDEPVICGACGLAMKVKGLPE